jgi:hypothetical protein
MYDATWELVKEEPLADVLPERSRLLFPDAVVRSGTIPKLFPQLGHTSRRHHKKPTEAHYTNSPELMVVHALRRADHPIPAAAPPSAKRNAASELTDSIQL